MRINVSGADTAVTDEKRAYAEYRFFTSIAAHVARVRAVDVVVRRDGAKCPPFLCTVTIDLGPSGRIKTQARAVHPIAAMDRAADRAAWLVARRVRADFRLKSPACSS